MQAKLWCKISLGLALAVLLLPGCAKKSITKSRSELIKDAKNKGTALPSVEEDRAKFYAYEAEQQKRLLELVQKRAADPKRSDNYRIGPEDELELNVFDVPELNVSARVRESGFITLPLLGAVKVGGLTEAEIHEQLRERLKAYVKNPQINVTISHYGSQKVAVIGSVFKPGSYSLKKGSNTLLELLSEAGGLTDKAGGFINFVPSEVSGLASTDDTSARASLALDREKSEALRNSAIEISLDQAMGTGGSIPVEVAVRGGDMIIVPEAGKVTVDGEVEKPASYDLGQRMTLLGSLAAAGGITYSAKVDEIEIIREPRPGQKIRLVMDLSKLANGEDRDVRLRNGDIVRVPSDAGRRLRVDTFEGFQQLINFGVGGSLSVVP